MVEALHGAEPSRRQKERWTALWCEQWEKKVPETREGYASSDLQMGALAELKTHGEFPLFSIKVDSHL